MKPNDLQNVPKASQGFHKRLVQTLDSLPERKDGIPMKRKHLTKLLIAAAVVTVMAATVIAGGRMLMITGHSYHGDDYQELPTAAWAGEKIGAEPKLTEEFSNGYTFDHGGITQNEITTEGNSKTQPYVTLDLTYRKADESVELSLSSVPTPVSSDAEQIERDGITFHYDSYTHKIVPVDYKETEEDKAAAANGELVLGWGAETVEVYEFQALVWEQNGVQYHLYGHDLTLTQDDLSDMACELMAS